MAKSKNWSQDELDMLIELYPIMDTVLLAEKIGRSYKAVSVKAVRLNLKKEENNNWTQDEINTLTDNYDKLSNIELEKMLKNRSKTAIQSMATKLGLQKEEAWSNEEILKLKSLYETHDNKEISKILNKTLHAVNIKANRLGLKKPVLYNYNEKYFDIIDTEEKAYWLGFIYADGYVSNSERNWEFGIEISTKDKEHLSKFNKALSSNVPINIKCRKSPSSENIVNICNVRFYSKYLVESLIKKGVVYRKTSILKFPNFIENNLMKHFIRGFIDGDGYISFRNRPNKNSCVTRTGFVCNSKEFVDEFVSYIHSTLNSDIFGISIDKNNYNVATTNQEGFIKFLDFIYDGATVYLERKYNNYLLGKQYILSSPPMKKFMGMQREIKQGS